MRKLSTSKSARTIDDYLLRLPERERIALTRLRTTIKSVAPNAEELISYQIPSFKYHYMLVGFAAFKSHCSFFVMSSSVLKRFAKELAPYKTTTGTIHFSVDKPIPTALIKKIVKVRVEENEGRQNATELIKEAKAKPAKGNVKSKPTEEDEVNDYLGKLTGIQRQEVEAVRRIIKGASPKLGERIKWNAPSYYYKQDIVTFGPYRTHKLLLVFHHPAVVNIKSKLLEGNYKNRRLVHFRNTEEATQNKKELTRIITEIIKSIDKQQKK